MMANHDANRVLSRRVALAGLAVIVACAATVRISIADTSLWFDEQASMFFSDQPFSRLWSDWMLRETNPPLYYSLLRAWRALVGSSDVAIRALSVGGSLLAIVLIYRLTSRLYGRRAGLIAAALAAVSGQHLYYAEQARGYIFLLCALLVAIDAVSVLTADGVGRGKAARAAVGYVVAATLAIYLHTTAILFPAIATLAVLIADPTWLATPRRLVLLIGSNLLIVMGSGWEIRQAVLQLLHHNSNIAPIGLVGPHEISRESLHTLFLAAVPGFLTLAIALMLSALVLGFVALDRRRYETRLLIAIGAIALLVLSSLGMVVPVFVPRTIFWISVVPTILAASAIARLPRPALRWGVAAALVAALAFDTARVAPMLEQEDWNTPVDVLARHPGAVLIVEGEATAVLADGICRHRLRVSACPYPIIAVIDPQDRYDTWAEGSYSGTTVAVERLRAAVGARTVFFFRKNYGHDLPELLHARGLGAGVPVNGPVFIGPLSASTLL